MPAVSRPLRLLPHLRQGLRHAYKNPLFVLCWPVTSRPDRPAPELWLAPRRVPGSVALRFVLSAACAQPLLFVLSAAWAQPLLFVLSAACAQPLLFVLSAAWAQPLLFVLSAACAQPLLFVLSAACVQPKRATAAAALALFPAASGLLPLVVSEARSARDPPFGTLRPLSVVEAVSSLRPLLVLPGPRLLRAPLPVLYDLPFGRLQTSFPSWAARS